MSVMVRVDGERRAMIRDDVHRKWCACYRAVRFRRRYFGDPIPELEVIVGMLFCTNQGPSRAVNGLAQESKPE